MTNLHPILPLGDDVQKGEIAGRPGHLSVIPVSQLRIDDAFQRSISAASVKNIRRICAQFSWAKFLPVIVVRQGDVYSVIDGQHRSMAALTLGITEVPCYILDCSPGEAAAAFAAINGNVTPVGPVDIWFASIVAGDPESLRLQKVLDAASVKITRKKDGLRAGETRSINVLRRAMDKYGPDLLTTILQCITETGEGNPGMIVGSVVNGIGMAIRTKQRLIDNPSELFEIFDEIDLSMMSELAKIEFARTGNAVQFILTRNINAKISKHEGRLAHAV